MAGPKMDRRRALGAIALAAFGSHGCEGPYPKVNRAGAGSLPERVNRCSLDPARFEVLGQCAISCGPEHPADEWQHACLHPHTQAYSCGRLARPGGPNEHDHPDGEVRLCRRVAAEASALLEGIQAVGSEGGDPYVPFFMAANRPGPVPDRITPDLVRTFFGGTIYPGADVVVEPLRTSGDWWDAVRYNYGFGPDGSVPDPRSRRRAEEDLARWKDLVAWFAGRDELHAPSYVAIGELPLGDVNYGCMFPRLLVGLTRAGSLAGTATSVVHT